MYITELEQRSASNYLVSELFRKQTATSINQSITRLLTLHMSTEVESWERRRHAIKHTPGRKKYVLRAVLVVQWCLAYYNNILAQTDLQLANP